MAKTTKKNKISDKKFEELGKMCADSNKTHPFEIDKNYLIRLVTHYWVGKLVRVFDGELVLSNASWVADTGRFHNALETGNMSEIEFVSKGNVILGRGALVDAEEWVHALPSASK